MNAAVAVTVELLSRRISIENDELIVKKSVFHPKKDIIEEKPVETQVSETESSSWPIYCPSVSSQMTNNPIRQIIDVMNVKPNADKKPIKMSLGDPTVAGLFKPIPAVTQAITQSAASNKFDGYGPSTGREEVRAAIANKFSRSEAPVTSDDVYVTCGASQALQLAIEVLANPGDNILLPSPGFPLYSTLMQSQGIKENFYTLLEDNNWQVDLDQMESLINDKTKAIIVTNPSNPCGSVYSKEHLEQILTIAQKHKLPVIADEIYGELTWEGHVFHPMATLEPKVPILTVDGISKRWLVPGWRLGWLIVHNRHGALNNIRKGITQLTQKIMGPSCIVQGAVPSILSNTPKSQMDDISKILSINCDILYETLKNVPGINPVKPYGAFYFFIGIDLKSFPEFQGIEMEFCKRLIAEESVYVLPGTTFNYKKGAARLTLALPEKMTAEAGNRIKSFCTRHYKNNEKI